MAKKIEILGNSLTVTDTVSGLTDIVQPKKDTWYIDTDLKNGIVKFRSIAGFSESREESIYPTFTLAESVDSALVAFTETTLRTFITTNLGA